MVLCLFSYLLICKNSTIFYDPTLLRLILYLSLFKCFEFFKFNMPSQKSDKNNCIRIIFTKIIIKINVIKIYIKNTHFISRKCDSKRIKNIKKVFNFFYLTCNKQSGISFNATKEWPTASSHIFWVLYLSGQYTIKKGS